MTSHENKEYYHSKNRATSQTWKILPNMVFPRFWGKNGGVLSMRMQVIMDTSFARSGSAPIWGGKKGELRDWTTPAHNRRFDRLGSLCSPPPSRAASASLLFLRRRNTRYKNSKHAKLVAQHCFVASFRRRFPFLTLCDQLVAQQKHLLQVEESCCEK